MSTPILIKKLNKIAPYVLLWGFTLLIVTAMLMLDSYNYNLAERKIMKPGFNSSSVTNETINELLLSAKDLNMDEKKSFINLYLKSSNNFEPPDNRLQPESIYNKIFEKKFDIIKKKRKEVNFSIKPVPK